MREFFTPSPYDVLDTEESTPTVLLVEDDRDLRQGTELVLKLENFTVIAAADGQEALDLLRSGTAHPDIIVSDIKMPRMDGYSLLDNVRQMPDVGPLPFIFLTAYGSPEHMRNAHERGIDEYLVKPFDPEKLVIVIRNKLRRAQSFRRRAEEQLDKVRRHIIEMLSHELRTPLTTVVGGFDILEETMSNPQSPRKDEDLQFSLNMMRIGIQRLNRVMEQTLRYSELINGHLRLQYSKIAQPMDFNTVLKKAIQIAEHDAKSHHITLELVSTLPQPTNVKMLVGSLIAALYEVLRNAILFSHADQTVTIEVGQKSGQIELVIRDQGRGIPADVLPSLTQPFFQFDRDKQEQQGIGLGLAIAYGTVQIHLGDFAILSEFGKGTTVTILLPIAPPQQ
ncbi:MAG: hybrid sensor histidine kinase/response regulator [Anaerolineae bacterium]|nr:hybrid sensor histidine kinase/response regulator [Anaerolineae bacterium]